MPNSRQHPVDALTDAQLFAMMSRVNTAGFPARLEDVWRVERGRIRETLRRIPPARHANASILDLGSSRVFFPFFRLLLGYQRVVLNTSYPDAGFVSDDLSLTEHDGPSPQMSIFDVERDEFPFDDASFDVVTCLEVLEHLSVDPMSMMNEINRVLRPGGLFVLTTPNVARTANVVNILLGEHPCGWTPYNGFDSNRHNREYTPREIETLLHDSGMNNLEVSTFGNKPRGALRDALSQAVRLGLLLMPGATARHRNDVIIAAGLKATPIRNRRPAWLYFDMAERQSRTAEFSVVSERTENWRPAYSSA